ncbi:hypothetical protein C2E23DRAFT_335649 [Lenzites betulinus]|nr:hypothetical protein C2E23DRAFT_335649 [Lenzites betulinus]
MQSLRRYVWPTILRPARHIQTRLKATLADVDSTGIPLNATWSVNKLLSSYPRPTVSSDTLKRLHELSALIPPEEGSPEHAGLSQEIEDLVKLVEAVKHVDVSQVPEDGEHAVPDGRIWAEGEGIVLDADPSLEDGDSKDASGRTLLVHASRTLDGLYVVEADKPRH